jgi:hypothetical protein
MAATKHTTRWHPGRTRLLILRQRLVIDLAAIEAVSRHSAVIRELQ